MTVSLITGSTTHMYAEEYTGMLVALAKYHRPWETLGVLDTIDCHVVRSMLPHNGCSVWRRNQPGAGSTLSPVGGLAGHAMPHMWQAPCRCAQHFLPLPAVIVSPSLTLHAVQL